ncbi:hypothetical protein [Marinobacterium arenosum]|uniref:hypothetical protein n=1 Tax=Marinobacterium arenosum TaxID=2862496 RepID=UPI001C973E65|nr:hypothetical protein [Marinobacterium arenosum]MBY4676402.1 hypothetical protein [Marinobacterium arenosum]
MAKTERLPACSLTWIPCDEIGQAYGDTPTNQTACHANKTSCRANRIKIRPAAGATA